MDFTNKELRNPDKALLRRIERQFQEDESERFVPQSFWMSPQELGEDEPISLFEEPIKPKKTRLSLFENRKGNR